MRRPERVVGMAWLIGSLILASGLLSGCSPKKEFEAPARIGINSWAGYEPLEMAAEAGRFSSREAVLLRFDSTRVGLRKFIDGDLDALGATLEEALWLAKRKKDFRIAQVLDVSDGGDVLIARPGAELSAKKPLRVGVERFGPGERLLLEALRARSLPLSAIILIHTPAEEQAAAFAEGKVDAVATFEPQASAIEQMGGVRLFDSSKMTAKIVDVLLVSESALREPSKVRGICAAVRGHLEKVKEIREHPQAAEEEVSRLREDAENRRTSWDLMRFPGLEESRHDLSDPQRAPRWATMAAKEMKEISGWDGEGLPASAFGAIDCDEKK